MIKYKRIVLSILIFILMFSLFSFTSYIEYKRTIASDTQTLKDKLLLSKTNIENNISSKVEALNGLKTYIELDNDFGQKEYSDFVKRIYDSSNDIIKSLNFIIDTKITYVYPYEENMSIIGKDLTLLEDQKDLILYAKQNNKTIVTAPIQLMEGGIGIIVRIPVINNGIYYGQMAVVFDYYKMIEYSGLKTLSDDYFIKLGTIDNVRNQESIIWTNSQKFPNVFDYNAVSTDINMYNANLTLEAVPKHAYNRKTLLFKLILLIGMLVSLGASLLTYRLMKTTRILEKNKEELEHSYNKVLATNNTLEKTVNQLKESENKLQIQYDESKKQEEYIRFLAERDFLTNLYNRRKLSMDLEESLKTNKNGTILFIDIDDFKNINDTLGHHYGDKVLQHVSVLLENLMFINNYTPYRMGGDEFVIDIPNIIDKEKMEEVIINLFEILCKNHYIDNIKNNITGSIGVVRYPEDATSVDDIVMKADIAMYSAKKLGKNRYCYFVQDMIESLDWKISIEKELREAVERNLFYLMYQPIVNANTGRLLYFEALIRMRDSNIPPNIFIPVAEEMGLIIQIGRWVIQESMTQIKTWESLGLQVKKVSVNVSPKQFQDHGLVDYLKDMMSKNDIHPYDFEIEITESVLLDDIDQNIKILEQIKELGINIALDDFGTGYSSLSYLTYIPVDKIKLDKSLKDRFLNMENEQAIKGLVALCHGLELDVVVEGVETKKESETLKLQNVDYFQGYYYSRPMISSDATKYIEEDRNKDQ